MIRGADMRGNGAPHYVPIFLGIGIAQPIGFLLGLALIALVNSL